MPRNGVSFEEVRAAADALVGEGIRPGVRSVRERLRDRGSANTIHRHLRLWEASRPEAPTPIASLPEALVRALNAEIERAVAAARAEIDERLVRALAEAEELATTGEALEAQCEALAAQVVELTTGRDVQIGIVAGQAQEITALKAEVEGERRAAEEARVATAKAQLAGEAGRTQLDEWRKRVEQLQAQLDAERQARVAAERDLAAAVAARDGVLARLADSQAREDGSARELVELRARATAEADRLRDEVDRLRAKAHEDVGAGVSAAPPAVGAAGGEAAQDGAPSGSAARRRTAVSPASKRGG